MNLGKMEVIKTKGKIISLRTAFQKDGREFIELDNCLRAFFNVKEDKLREMVDLVPKSYIKNVQINDEKIKFIDCMALGIFLNEKRNYDFFQWYIGRQVSKLDNYAIELFRDSATLLLERSGQVGILKDKIKKYDEIQQDLLHQLENNAQSDEEKIEFANKVITMRHERRSLKNQLAFDQVAKDFFNAHNIVQKSINEVSKEMARLENIFEKKIYVERAKTSEHEEVKREIAKKVETLKATKQLTEQQKQARLTRMMKKARIK